jgi:RND family efflux transporter MFP subunit
MRFIEIRKTILHRSIQRKHPYRMLKFEQIAVMRVALLLAFAAFTSAGCRNADPKDPPPQPLPVKTETISLAPVPRLDEYVATVKSRRSANIQPRVDGSLTRIAVKSGDRVQAGQSLMTVDPLKQQSVVEQQRSTETQKRATFQYNEIELERQRKLYQGGVTSKESLDLATQAYENSKADWESSTAARVAEQRQLAYYDLTAPFSGVVGDIPVHVGDYVSPQTLLTTVDENAELEAYIYIPTERAANIRMGLRVQIVTSTGELIENTKIYFISQQVDNATQGILVKAPVHGSLERYRNAQLVKARVVWSTAPAPTVPVLAITRIGGQTFVYVAVQGDAGTVAKQRAVTLGDTIGNDYAVTSGLKPGDKVVVSGTQFLIDGVPIHPIS